MKTNPVERHTAFQLLVFAVLLFTMLSLSSCGRLPETSFRQEVVGGEPDRASNAFQEYGCIACHRIPGVPRAQALVAPPLDDWADRRYIAGQFANTPENLIQWIMFPQELSPGSAMPDMGVTEADARDMAAYLFTLRRGR